MPAYDIDFSKFLIVSDQTRQVKQLYTANEITFQRIQRHNHSQIICSIVE